VKRLVVRDEDAPCGGDSDERREQREEEPPQPTASRLPDYRGATADGGAVGGRTDVSTTRRAYAGYGAPPSGTTLYVFGK